jgi:uncharacterized protein YndB with AHSA1/START domain
MHLAWTAVVDRPIEDVWRFVFDPFNRPRQRGGALSLRPTSREPPGVGSTFEQRSELLGFEYRLTGEIAEFKPPRLLVVRLEGGPVKSALGRFAFEPTASGTRLTIEFDADRRTWFRLLGPVIDPLIRSRWETSNRNLVRLLETELRPSAPR